MQNTWKVFLLYLFTFYILSLSVSHSFFKIFIGVYLIYNVVSVSFFFWLRWVFVAACRLSLVAPSGGWGVALGLTGSRAWAQ